MYAEDGIEYVMSNFLRDDQRVSGEHDDANAKKIELGDDFLGVTARGIGQGEKPHKLILALQLLRALLFLGL